MLLQVLPILIMEKPVSSILRKEVLRPILEFPHLSLQISRWKILTTAKPKSPTSQKERPILESPQFCQKVLSKWKTLTTAKHKSNTSAKDQLNPVSLESWDPSKWKILTTAKPKSNT